MKMEDIEAGINVVINKNISRTIREFSANDTMRGMMGNRYKIKSVACSESVMIKNYRWHIDDISEEVPEVPAQPFHFDVKELGI